MPSTVSPSGARKRCRSSRCPASGLSVSLHKVSLAAAGGPYWAYLGTVRVQGLQPIYGLDAQIRAGKYLLDLSVSAGSAAAAKRLAPKLAHQLRHRLQLALKGRLHGKAVKLPPALQPGPPAGGPHPDALVLTKQDLGGFTTIRSSAYSTPKSSIDENAISVYDLTAAPAGSFAYLQQEVFVAGSESRGRVLRRPRPCRGGCAVPGAGDAGRCLRRRRRRTGRARQAQYRRPDHRRRGCRPLARGVRRLGGRRLSLRSLGLRGAEPRTVDGAPLRRRLHGLTYAATAGSAVRFRRPGRASAGRARGRAR